MKEKAPREVGSARKPATVQAGAAAGDHAMQHSPAMAAQRQQLERAFGNGKKPAQRVKGKPTQEALEKQLAGCVSSEKGSCCGMTIEAAQILRGLADEGDVKAVLLTWAENEELGEVEVGNHTACLVTWSEGTFIVDTTAGQFGGPAVYVASQSDWVGTITGLQKPKVTDVRTLPLAAPLSSSSMHNKTGDHLFDVNERVKKKGKQAEPVKDTGVKDAPKKSKCFLTSACIAWRGLPDDCRELTVLRAFRDGHLSALPEGPVLIDEYYRIAPALVEAIEASRDADRIHERIWHVVRGCVRYIEAARPQQALDDYVSLVRALQAAFPMVRQEESHDQ